MAHCRPRSSTRTCWKRSKETAGSARRTAGPSATCAWLQRTGLDLVFDWDATNVDLREADPAGQKPAARSVRCVLPPGKVQLDVEALLAQPSHRDNRHEHKNRQPHVHTTPPPVS